MMLGVIPMSFRFRGKLHRLREIYRCFLDHPNTGLHPTQISRHTGISFGEVSKRLQATPELFVKLPRRDGVTRYRLTSSTTARTPEQVEEFLLAQSRRESMMLYAFGGMLVLLLLIVAILVAPAVGV